MSRQRHDSGYRKRQAAQVAPQPATGRLSLERLAQRLVRRGLASPAILEHRHQRVVGQ